MGRKLYIKGSNATDRKIISYNTNYFGAGVIKDNPATTIPDSALADGQNVTVIGNEVRGRLGSTLYTSTKIPAMVGRTGLQFSQTGTTVTCLTSVFDATDVGNYVVWPGSGTDDTHDEIIAYIDANNVTVATSASIGATPDCYISGKRNGWHFHDVLKTNLFMLGDEFWTANSSLSTFTQVRLIGGESPNNCKSEIVKFDDWSWLVFNSAGWFHVTKYQTNYYVWRRNIPIPNTQITEHTETANTKFCYGYIYGAARLTEQGMIIDRLTPSRVELETGTNVYDKDLKDYSDVYTVSAISSSNGVIISELHLPIVTNTVPQKYQQHLTHYPIYRTLDKLNKYNNGQLEDILNDPESFIWVKDLRICAAFFARKFNGHVLAKYGEFEIADIGSVIEWENGDRDTIVGFVAKDEVTISKDAYYGEETDYMACAIGNGIVYRASKTGTTVTRTHGGTFSSTDVGKTITWSTGYRSIITAYTDANTVTVEDNQDFVSQGATSSPESRNFYDNTSDDELRTRMSELMVRTRFLVAMPNVNDGAIGPGFIVTCRKNASKQYWCFWEENWKFTAGFYYKGYQESEVVKDPIKKIMVFPNKIVYLCANSKTWHCPTGTNEKIELPSIGVIAYVLSGIDILNDSIGCFDEGSIQQVDNGVYVMLTSEPNGVGLRTFDGMQYSENMLELNSKKLGTFDTWKKNIDLLQKATCSLYDAQVGYLVWGKNKP